MAWYGREGDLVHFTASHRLWKGFHFKVKVSCLPSCIMQTRFQSTITAACPNHAVGGEYF